MSGASVPAPVMSGLERRRRESRRVLQAAAITLVGQRGLAAVTADDIATAAGVSRRTFFNHYSWRPADPPELLPQLGRQGLDRIAGGL